MGDSKRSKDDRKTKKELVAELEELRRKLSDDDAGTRSSTVREPTLSGDISRRDALKIAWVAPVILSVPLASIGGARRAQAQAPGSPTIGPTAAPSLAPTVFPTVRAVPAISGAGAAAASALLFGVGAKRIREKIRDASGFDGPKKTSSDDSDSGESGGSD